MWVVVDTNKLPRNPLKGSAAYDRVCQLSQGGHIQVAIPETIENEWKTQAQDQVYSQAQKAQSSIKNLLTGGSLADAPQFDPLGGALPHLEAVKRTADQLADQLKQELIERLSAQVQEIADDHGKRVSDAYFSGSPPFKTKKRRDDFPDAFIYESVVDLSGQYQDQEIAVVTNDGNLAKCLSALPNVVVFSSLEELVESPNLAQIVAAIESEAAWNEAFDQVLQNVEQIAPDLMGVEFTTTFIDEVAYSTVYHQSIPSDNKDATISMVDDPIDVELHWDEAENYGPGRIRVPFSCESEVLLDFLVYYADAYGLPDHFGVTWSDPDDNPYFEVQAHTMALVSAFALVSLPTPVNDESYDNAQISVDEIADIELNEDDIGNVLY